MQALRIPRHCARIVCFLIPINFIFGSAALAGWTAVSLHPGGATTSTATGIRLGKASGTVDGQAVVWTGIPSSISMTTLGLQTATGTDGVEISGQGSNVEAAVWSLSPTTYTDLTPSPTPTTNPPSGFVGSSALGVFDGRQAGVVGFSDFGLHAGYWSDSGASFVDLNGNTAGTHSIANGVGFDAGNNLEEVGYGVSVAQPSPHAIIWHDDAASALDVNPATAAQSELTGVSFGKQSGWIIPLFSGTQHAGFWSGTSGSFVDLQPSDPSVVESIATGIYNNGTSTTEAGIAYIGVGEIPHASYWDSTVSSWVDLQTYLPANYTSSEATGIWTTNAGLSYITGDAFNSLTGQKEAMLWEQTVPEPGVISVLCVVGGMMVRRRVRHSREQ